MTATSLVIITNSSHWLAMMGQTGSRKPSDDRLYFRIRGMQRESTCIRVSGSVGWKYFLPACKPSCHISGVDNLIREDGLVEEVRWAGPTCRSRESVMID